MHPITIVLLIIFIIVVLYFIRLGTKTGTSHSADPHDTHRLWEWFKSKR
ncbi:hypothetical protein [Alkalicoccus halolimnae]|uniref:Uncharacterized protein n=1 Tax=Alkalicoccus halolimnae TaxID=1667239 RepID=A0AAJ8MZQ0_9BACI|nr:hypothetical protein [Alkalicoccus halolimnae]